MPKETDNRRIVSLHVRRVEDIAMDKDTIYVDFGLAKKGYLYTQRGYIDTGDVRSNVVTARAASNKQFMTLCHANNSLTLVGAKEADTKAEEFGNYRAFIPADAFVDHLVGYNNARIDASELINNTIPAYKQFRMIKKVANNGPWL